MKIEVTRKQFDSIMHNLQAGYSQLNSSKYQAECDGMPDVAESYHKESMKVQELMRALADAEWASNDDEKEATP
jgi:hypothetical protein